MSEVVTHLIDRTSPAGPGKPFVGRCRLCGAENLPFEAALQPCPNPKGISQDDALVAAIEGETP